MMEALLMAPSLLVALIHRQGDAAAFLYTMGLTRACGAALGFLLHPDREDLTARDGMAVAGLSWLLLLNVMHFGA